jgi:hypothetical protein
MSSFLTTPPRRPTRQYSASGLVVVVADPTGRQLVRGDVVDELDRRIPRDLLTIELAAEEFGILGEVEDPTFDLDGITHHEHSRGQPRWQTPAKDEQADASWRNGRNSLNQAPPPIPSFEPHATLERMTQSL